MYPITINTNNRTQICSRLGISLVISVLTLAAYSQNSFADLSDDKVGISTEALGLKCGIFDSCIDPIIRIFPFMHFKWSPIEIENNDTLSSTQTSQIDPFSFSGSSLFQLPFP
jgi:hypothetical protein